jgi:hypothetical protein
MARLTSIVAITVVACIFLIRMSSRSGLSAPG